MDGKRKKDRKGVNSEYCSVRGYTVLTPQELAINWHMFHKASRILHRIGFAYIRRYILEDFLSSTILDSYEIIIKKNIFITILNLSDISFVKILQNLADFSANYVFFHTSSIQLDHLEHRVMKRRFFEPLQV